MTAPSVEPAIDRSQEPWLGLESYRQEDARVFHGRREETEALLRMVRREVLTTLFGPSGTGKTSLLKAGLSPRLAGEEFLLVHIRLSYSPTSPDLREQIRGLVKAACQEHGVEEDPGGDLDPPVESDETPWEYLHRVAFWDRRNQLLTPILFFDQFEELFTLGKDFPTTALFLEDLADLVENYVPRSVRARLEATGRKLSYPMTQRYKVVISLREDFVHHLDTLRPAMPSIMHNRYALKRMNGEQALDAVREPGRSIVAGDVAERIVRLVAARNEAASAPSARELKDLEVEPALLSVVCRELNARRLQARRPSITAADVATDPPDILGDFYDRSFDDLPPVVRVFVEERLLTPSGYRNTAALDDAERAGVSRAAVDTLVQRRLVRIEERLGIPHVELTHDVLTKVAQASRDLRRAQAEHAESERLTAEDERRRRRRVLTIVLATATCLTLALAVLAAYYGYHADRERRHSDELRGKATTAFALADQRRRELENAQALETAARERAEQEAQVAKAALGQNEARAKRPAPALRPSVGPRDHVLTIDPDGKARVWDVSSVTVLFEIVAPSGGAVTAAAFNRQGDVIAAASDDGQVRIWSVSGRRVVGGFGAPRGTSHVAFAPDMRSLVIGHDRWVRVLDLPAGAVVRSIDTRLSGPIAFLDVTSDGKRVVVSDGARAVVWVVGETSSAQQVAVDLISGECLPVRVEALNYEPEPGYRAILVVGAVCRSEYRARPEPITLTPAQLARALAPAEDSPEVSKGPPSARVPTPAPQAPTRVPPPTPQAPASGKAPAAQQSTLPSAVKPSSVRWQFALNISDPKGEPFLAASTDVESSTSVLSDVVRSGFNEQQLRAVVYEIGMLMKKVPPKGAPVEQIKTVIRTEVQPALNRIVTALGLKTS